MSSSGPTTIRVERSARVATLTLNRPEKLNAWNRQMGYEVFTALRELDEDDETRAIVVTGSGRAFCAGADLAAAGETFSRTEDWEDFRRLEARVWPWNMHKPVIAALNGPAVGIGATLPLWWDIRLASEQAKLGFAFVRRGVSPEAGSTWILPRLVGQAVALDLMLTGRLVSAAEAQRVGLVHEVLPHDQLLPRAHALGREIAESTAPASIALTKRLLWEGWMGSSFEVAKEREDSVFAWLGRMPDAMEGIGAFLQKRAPVWAMSALQELSEIQGATGAPAARATSRRTRRSPLRRGRSSRPRGKASGRKSR